MAASDTIRPRIAIIGSGLTGLMVAQGLRKHGFQATVFERDEHVDSRPRDWTILIHWAMKILEELVPADTKEKLPTATTNPFLKFEGGDEESLPAHNGLTGELLFRLPHPGGRRVSRQALRKVLLSDVDVKWGKKLQDLTSSDECVRLTFADGETFDADFVVGADGSSSKVRELLLGVEAGKPTLSGYTFATVCVKYGDAEKVDAIRKLHPVAAISFYPGSPAGCGVLNVPDPDDLTTWTMFWVKIWRGGLTNLHGQEALDYMKEHTKNYFEPFQSAVDWTTDASRCHADEMKYWVPIPWNNHDGRVTIVGDAAHPMLPYRGQGLQHAITDADNYVKVITAMEDFRNVAKRTEIMTSYDNEMIARGAEAVTQSIGEAEKSLDLEAMKAMLMVQKGLTKTA